MKWSLLVGKAWGTEIRLHLSMLLLVPYALIAFRPQDITGTIHVLLLIAAIFVCVALHELGHTFAARYYGIRVKSIVLWPLGGFANLSRRPETVLPDLVISAAGPLANMLIFAALLTLLVMERLLTQSMILPALSRAMMTANVFPFLVGLAFANLSLAVFNLLPVYPLDGGQIARGLLKLIVGEKWADRAMLVVSLPLALALAVFGLYSKDPLVVLTAGLLLLAGSSLSIRLFNSLVMSGLYVVDRGGFYLKKSDFDPALRHFTRGIEKSPGRSGAYISRAIALMNLLQTERASADIRRALELDPKNFVGWALMGELLSLENKQSQALEAYNRAIELRPDWSMAYLDRGGLYLEMGQMEEAQADMNHSIDLAQGSAIHHLHRSMLRYLLNDSEGARRDMDAALRYAPQWMLVFPEIFLFTIRGKLNWALVYYRRAIESMPNAYQAYQGRADACRVNDRIDWAILDYNRAIQLAPTQAEPYLGRGRCFLKTGDSAKASADFSLAAQHANRAHIRRQADDYLIRAAAAGGAPPHPSPAE